MKSIEFGIRIKIAIEIDPLAADAVEEIIERDAWDKAALNPPPEPKAKRAKKVDAPIIEGGKVTAVNLESPLVQDALIKACEVKAEEPSDPLLSSPAVSEPTSDDLLGDVSPASVDGPDALDNLLAEVAEIDNDQLYNAAMAYTKVKGQAGVPALKKLISSFATQLTAIPQDKRAEFLAGVAKLQANGVAA